MKTSLSLEKLMRIFLWLIAMHSFIVGILLVCIPVSLLPIFGFENYIGKFFTAQGGVFHIVMAFAYALAATDLNRHQGLIILTIFAKCMATIFLLIYYIVFEQIWMVLLSAVGDGTIAVVVWISYVTYIRTIRQKQIGSRDS